MMKLPFLFLHSCRKMPGLVAAVHKDLMCHQLYLTSRPCWAQPCSFFGEILFPKVMISVYNLLLLSCLKLVLETLEEYRS